MVGCILVVSIVRPYIFLAATPLAIIFIVMRKYFLRTGQQLKQLETEGKARQCEHSLHAVVRYVFAVGKGFPDALSVLTCGLLPGMKRPVRQVTDERSVLGPKTAEEQRMDKSTRKRKGYLRGSGRGGRSELCLSTIHYWSITSLNKADPFLFVSLQLRQEEISC